MARSKTTFERPRGQSGYGTAVRRLLLTIAGGLCTADAVPLVACGGNDISFSNSNSKPNAGTSSAGSSGNSGSGGSASGVSASAISGSSNSFANSGSGASVSGVTSGSSNGSEGSGGSSGGASPLDSGSNDAQIDTSAASDAPGEAQAAYNPCPAKGTPCAVLALGDSITAGTGSSTGGSYRAPLFHLALSHQQNITFVGNSMSGPNMVDSVTFPRGNEGHSGFTIDDGGGHTGIHNLTAPAMTKFHPHIVTLMIGTNDIVNSIDLPNAPSRLGGDPADGGTPSLIDTILRTDPNVLLVVAQIIPTTNDAVNARVRAYNDAIPALVKKRADSGKHILLVDMYGAFTANANYKTDYMNDALHPKDAGYAKMADVWYAAIGSLLR
jgi:lysophospholipase L1-like esterase